MLEPIITMVAAMAEERVIGKNNGLPWRAKGDFQFFKDYTVGKPLVMGRKTFESLKQFGVQPLPKRPNLVITRDENYSFDHPDVSIHHDLKDAIQHAKSFGSDEICIGGGGVIYALALPIANKILLTEIHQHIDGGDAFFPEFSNDDWQETERDPRKAEAGDTADYTFTTWVRR